MARTASASRQFSVRARHVDAHHARILIETSFEAAAVAYVEDFHPGLTDGQGIGVVVRDIATGHEHCFLIDPESGETSPCF